MKNLRKILNNMNIPKHRNISLKILKDIYGDPSVGTVLGFKGGTAAMFFYELDRFSVDLDFDLLDQEKEDYVFDKINIILSKYGIVKEARKKRFNLLYILSYTGKSPKDHNIKIEINRRSFGSKYDIRSFLGISMQVMVQEDMFANKFCALYERIGKTNRDIYDVWFFLNNNWPINKKIIEERFNMSYSEFLKKVIKVMDQFDNKNILAGMGELVNEKQKIWIKSKLKKEVLFLLRLELDSD